MPKSAEIIMSIRVIIDHPKDYPDHFVVRRWDVERGNPEPVPAFDYALAMTLEQARQMLPEGLINIGRWPNDDPAILECWI